MLSVMATVDAEGRLVIPEPARKALGVRPGDRVAVELRREEVSAPRDVARARAIVADRLAGADLVAELIAERRAESERE